MKHAAALPAALALLLAGGAASADVGPRRPLVVGEIAFIGTVVERNIQHPACGRVASGGWATFRIERRISGRPRGSVVRVVLRCPEMLQVGQRYRLSVVERAPSVGPLSARQVTFPRDNIRTYWESRRRLVRG